MTNTTKTIASWLLVGSVMTTCFILIATFLPKVVNRELPFDRHLDIQSVTVEDIELPQHQQTATIAYEASSDLPVETKTQLVLVQVGENGSKIISRMDKPLVFEENDEQSVVLVERELPKDIRPGEFVWVYNFTIDVNGVEKSETVRSNVFRVTNSN